MAATIPEYVDPLLRRQEAAASLLGSSVIRADTQTYNINLGVLALIAVVMQALNDKGVVLDAEWLARLDTIPQGSWPQWVLKQLPPPT